MEEINNYISDGQVIDAESEKLHLEKMENTLRLERQLKSGANWFYWIAGLSIINTITYISGSDWSFINGLGITQIIDGIAYYFTGALQIGFFALDVLIALIFIYLGYRAGKSRKWAFIFGMVVYTLDALIFLYVKDFLSVGFHAMALFGIYNGLKASKSLNKHKEINIMY